ncbi:MAG: hypothetical protein IT458_07120 [Planctomycetes bacterium]|nr:hypothetical protein [Planctomycetota bacterium]
MQRAPQTVLVLGLLTLLAGAFLLGRSSATPDTLAAQGRGPGGGSGGGSGGANPPRPAPAPKETLVYPSDSASSASSNGVIAVTGSYGVGTSVLYVIDTVSRQMAVYEARGGSPNSRRLILVGARRIDLDLQLVGYNDDSEYPYDELRKRFEGPAAGAAPAERIRPDEPGRGAPAPGAGPGKDGSQPPGRSGDK